MVVILMPNSLHYVERLKKDNSSSYQLSKDNSFSYTIELSEAINLNDQYTEAYEERAKVYHHLGKEELAKRDEEVVKELKGELT